ncbi:microtubule-associated protein RP/EB family member 1-like [Sesamum indicum]|uniref:Microtubule-associated protein RP/EB family member 1-like n=1 Tax=Sesamum indicum TaxID=4182 RepID=A0A6I9T184_SESIN|nr:microtubule-associated protein RP/EB family member 1-like [Sesamum indicum]
MATIRRDFAPGKEKRTPPPPIGNTSLRGSTSLSRTTSLRGTTSLRPPANLRPATNLRVTPYPGTPERNTPSYLKTTAERNTPSYLKTTPERNTPSFLKPTPERNTPTYLQPTRPASTTDVSKQQTKKPITRPRSIDKPPPPSPILKPRVSTNPPIRPGKAVVLQKPIPDKNVKAPVVKNVGKRRPLSVTSARPVSSVKKSNASMKKQETGKSTSGAKVQIFTSPHKSMEHPHVSQVSVSVVLKPETQTGQQESLHVSSVMKPVTQTGHQEPCFVEAEEQGIKIVGYEDKGTDDLLQEDLETFDLGEIEEEYDYEAKIVIAESSVATEHENVSLGIMAKEPAEEQSFIQESSSKQQQSEEQSITEVNSSNAGESVADNPNDEAEQKEVEKEEGEGERASTKKDEAASGSEAHESKETEGLEVVDEKKQEAVQENKQEAVEEKKEDAVEEKKQEVIEEKKQEVVVEEKKQELHTPATKLRPGVQGKKDTAVSNDVIKETASKLREQRKNRVKALAGAFESVISLQEAK